MNTINNSQSDKQILLHVGRYKMDEIKESKHLVEILEEYQFTHWHTLLSNLEFSSELQLTDRDLADTQQVTILLDKAKKLTWKSAITSLEKCAPDVASKLQLSLGKEALYCILFYILLTEYLEKCILQDCPSVDELCKHVQVSSCIVLGCRLGLQLKEMKDIDVFDTKDENEKRNKFFSLLLKKRNPKRQKLIDTLVEKDFGADNHAYIYMRYLRLKAVRGMISVHV